MNTKISVIVPIYNAEKTIEKTLCSIYNQSYKNYEVLLIDDGSEDRTQKICLKYVSMDNRFTYSFQKNSGVSCARNNGLRKAQGKYIIFIDADDEIPSNSFTSLMNAQVNYKDGFICGSYVMKKTRNRKILKTNDFRIYNKSSPHDFLDGLDRLPTAPWAKIFNRSIIISHQIFFPKGIPFGEDAIFLYNYLRHVKEIITISDIVYQYNFLDSNSAGRKYYPDFCIYMHEQLKAKQKVYDDIDLFEHSEELAYFRRSIEHYIVNEINKKTRAANIRRCFFEFPDSANDVEYGGYVKANDIAGLVREWKKNNRNYFCIERIKRICAMITK